MTMLTIEQGKEIVVDTLVIHPRHGLCTVSGSLQEVLDGEGCEEYVKVVLTDGGRSGGCSTKTSGEISKSADSRI